MTRNKGFTLIELVMVIVILGILSAFAIPRYLDIQQQARVASIQGLQGAVVSAVAIVKAGWRLNGQQSPVSVDGSTVIVNTTTGYPTAVAGGIGNAVQFSTENYTVAYASNDATFSLADSSGNAIANCHVVYNAATGDTSLVTTGC